MINFNQAQISQLILHKISVEKDRSFINKDTYHFNNEEEEMILRSIFLKPFLKHTATYEFTHEVDLDLNPLYKLSKELNTEKNFIEVAEKIFQHLDSVSKHPNIKDGDLFIVQYDDIIIRDHAYQGLGIYKIENKEHFIHTSVNDGKVNISLDQGIGTGKVDKACFIVFSKTENHVLVVDQNKVETEYWKNEFVKVKLKNDDLNQTNQVMDLTRSFITEQFPNDFEVDKTEQIDLLNRSVEYFKAAEVYQKDQLEEVVLKDEQLIESFRNYHKNYDGEEGF